MGLMCRMSGPTFEAVPRDGQFAMNGWEPPISTVRHDGATQAWIPAPGLVKTRAGVTKQTERKGRVDHAVGVPLRQVRCITRA